MIQTQRGLAGLTVLGASAEPAFAGGEVALTSTCNHGCERRSGVRRGGREICALRTAQAEADDRLAVTLRFATARRGVWRAPVLRLSIHDALGLFRTWTWLSLQVDTLVYPQPRRRPPAAGTARVRGGLTQARRQPRRTGRGCGRFAKETRRARLPGKPTRAAHRCWCANTRAMSAATREFDFDVLANQDTEAAAVPAVALDRGCSGAEPALDAAPARSISCHGCGARTSPVVPGAAGAVRTGARPMNSAGMGPGTRAMMLLAFCAGVLLHVDRAPVWSLGVAGTAFCWQLAHMSLAPATARHCDCAPCSRSACC